MKKVYYIANARMPSERAHAIQIAKMCEALLLEGVDLTLVVPKRAFVSVSPQVFYGLSRDISVVYLPVLSRAYGAGKIGFWIGSLSFVFSYLAFLWSRFLRGERALGYSIDMDQFSSIGMPLSPYPYMMELHDAKPHGVLYSIVLRGALGIVTINSIIRDKLAVRFSLPAEKILVCPNGIDFSRFGNPVTREIARERLAIPLEAKIALYAGQLYAWKGLRQLIEFAERSPALDLYLVGGTKEELASFLPELAIPNNLICIGKRPYAEMPLWLQAADMLIVLGTKDNEYSYYHTSPMKLFEYMSAGVPILAADTPAIREVADESEVWFYQPDDAADMARVADGIFKLGGSARAIKSAEANTRAQGYSWKKRAEKVLAYTRVSASR
ncbi:MAG: glycosyltransferase family 4 protein [Patescibacteria group bacterium]